MASIINGYSNYLSERMQNIIFDNAPKYDFAGPWWVGLFSVVPLSDGSGGTETSGVSYARKDVTPSYWNSSVRVTGVIDAFRLSNESSIVFPVAGAGGWGIVNGFGIWDAGSGGNLLIGGSVSLPKEIEEGSQASFQGQATPSAGDLQIYSLNATIV